MNFGFLKTGTNIDIKFDFIKSFCILVERGSSKQIPF